MISERSRGEMDITTVFGTVIEGSNPPESTSEVEHNSRRGGAGILEKSKDKLELRE